MRQILPLVSLTQPKAARQSIRERRIRFARGGKTELPPLQSYELDKKIHGIVTNYKKSLSPSDLAVDLIQAEQLSISAKLFQEPP
jgi:hypothetical protein